MMCSRRDLPFLAIVHSYSLKMDCFTKTQTDAKIASERIIALSKGQGEEAVVCVTTNSGRFCLTIVVIRDSYLCSLTWTKHRKALSYVLFSSIL